MGGGKDENISELIEEIETDFAPITPFIYSSLENANQAVPECLKLITKLSNYNGENNTAQN